jgi:phosphoadenosine phosphosulfate reductase
MNINEKVTKSREILQEALRRFPNRIALAWTGGKDSTTAIHLLREIYGGKVPIPILNIDTSVKFPEIYEFRNRLAQEWQMNLLVERNEEAIAAIKIAENKEECCLRLKVEVISGAITKYGWEALITGLRWDEHAERGEETYFSHRETPPHFRVHPILHFTELDIWQYIKDNQVPYCSLYSQGYRSLGCAPCTQIGTPNGPERNGRGAGKEEIMARLRSMGYI